MTILVQFSKLDVFGVLGSLVEQRTWEISEKQANRLYRYVFVLYWYFAAFRLCNTVWDGREIQ